MKNKKNYVAIVRDHSGSMRSLASRAAEDYNSIVREIKEQAQKEQQDTIVSTIKCGVGIQGVVKRDVVNSNARLLNEISRSDYTTDGGCSPLWDSTMEAIKVISSVPDFTDPDVSFLVLVVTDGEENSSQTSSSELTREISRLQATDRWTFVFRVPRGMRDRLVRTLGVPSGNVIEWETTDEGMERSTRSTTSSIGTYYRGRAAGMKSTTSFYTDLAGVKTQTVKAKLQDVSDQVDVFAVNKEELIRDFVERKIRANMLKGAAFYQLTKTEKKVQDYKQILIREKKSGQIYSGVQARNLLGLPHNGDVKIVPGNHGGYDVFVQSTSVNRKLVPGTDVIYWKKIGTPFTEGPSAR